MNTEETIEIPASKKKSLQGLTGATAFVAASIYMLVSDHISTNFILRQPYVKNGIAIAGILLFAMGILINLIKLFRENAGLIINNEGITDSASLTNTGFIPWNEIIDIVPGNVGKKEFLTLMVRNPEKYVARQRSFILRNIMQLNLKTYGSPIQIHADSLKADLTNVKNIILARMAEQQAR